MTTNTCTVADCTGLVDGTGFCDLCGKAPRLPEHDDAAVLVGSAHVSSAPDSFSLPVFSFPDPSSRIKDNPEVPERKRSCRVCDHPVGRGYAGQPPLARGYCSNCREPYSFLPSLREGDLVDGRYKVVGWFAHGGQGWIYLARHTKLDDSFVVLKGLIDARDDQLAATERKALIMLDHPNIVRIFDFVTHPDQHTGEQRGYIVMEYVDGWTLREVCEEATKGRMPLGEPFLVEHVILCGLQILAALEYLHGEQLLYCDMKPANVMIRSGQHGERTNRVKVIDLGGVRRIGDATSTMVGTSDFAVSDEEIDSVGLTVRSDIHTVGVTLRELFAGTVDWADRASTANRIHVGLASFTRVVDRAAHKEFGLRFSSAAEMADQLRGVHRGFAALRSGRPHPEPSTVFAPTAALLDGGLGVVPPLRRWIDGDRPLDAPAPLPFSAPAPADVAAGLPVPHVDPTDPEAGFLADVDASNARRLLSKLLGHDSLEVELTRCRATLRLGAVPEARHHLKRAQSHVAATRQAQARSWRFAWHEGLLALAERDFGAARMSFETVHAALPGEDAPLLACAYCYEQAGQPRAAERYYHAVWQRDRAQVSAAFGLARLALAHGDRRTALAQLATVPLVSRHADAASIAQLLILCHPAADDRPSDADLAAAAQRLPGLHIEGSTHGSEARDRAITVIREAVLCWIRDNGGPVPVDGEDVFGARPDEKAVRRLLEESYRTLARQARDANAHAVLLDRANLVRPITLM